MDTKKKMMDNNYFANNQISQNKMNFKNHFVALYPLLIFTSVVLIGLVFYYLPKYGVPGQQSILLMIFIYLVFAIPAVFVHMEYILNDWGSTLIIDNKSKQIVYEKGKKRIASEFSDISRVYFFGETKAFNTLTATNYSFFYFKFKNGDYFIVTCLVLDKLDKLQNVCINKNRRIIPSILFEKKLDQFPPNVH
jgi:hypothetical protein